MNPRVHIKVWTVSGTLFFFLFTIGGGDVTACVHSAHARTARLCPASGKRSVCCRAWESGSIAVALCVCDCVSVHAGLRKKEGRIKDRNVAGKARRVRAKHASYSDRGSQSVTRPNATEGQVG